MSSLLLALCASLGYAQSAAKKTTHKASKHHSRSHRHAKKTSWKRHGQQQIAPDRAREIQTALIREHYLSGDPTGEWDARTQAAMVKYQSDNGWQSKVTPDSRALIKLGLGPDYSQELLNIPATSDAVASAGGPQAAATGRSTDKQ
ncbi:MAG TPA: peptidoglycan-binding domain-containing protein [Candidatus Angelobacter sp.]|nr:peptidoglycan-binding domain-containing protein [Candidatus Angelobacter sp.]